MNVDVRRASREDFIYDRIRGDDCNKPEDGYAGTMHCGHFVVRLTISHKDQGSRERRPDT